MCSRDERVFIVRLVSIVEGGVGCHWSAFDSYLLTMIVGQHLLEVRFVLLLLGNWRRLSSLSGVSQHLFLLFLCISKHKFHEFLLLVF